MVNDTLSTFNVSRQFYFREARKSVPAGATVDLPAHVAQEYMRTHPGLLKPVRQTAQGAPQAVRSEPAGQDPVVPPTAPIAPKASKPGKRKTAK